MTEPGNNDELEILKIAFAESVRKLSLPTEAANTIRSRAGTVMATATAVAGFLGGLALAKNPVGWQWILAVIALAAYVTSIGLCLHTIAPRFDAWNAGQNTKKLAEEATKDTLASVYRNLAISYQSALTSNEQVTRALARHLTWAIVAMVIEVVFLLWLLAAATTATIQPTTLIL